MAATDISIKEVRVTFSCEPFQVPYTMSSGTFKELTYAQVEVTAENRLKNRATGIGGILLSDLWAFPGTSLSHEEKDMAMRNFVIALGHKVEEMNGFGDPFQISHWIDRARDEMLQGMGSCPGALIPKLAAVVCASPFDAAIHDAWGKAVGRSVYSMYTAQFLNEDLSCYLGEGWEGRYPGQYLVTASESIPVQHVVGITDPLKSADGAGEISSGNSPPSSLEDWISKELVHHFKIKLLGDDIAWNLERILDVYRVAVECHARLGTNLQTVIAVDPNEACSHPDFIIELLKKLKERDPHAYEALHYIEQPTSRQLFPNSLTMHELSGYKPVLIDESLESLDNIYDAERLGWSGLALKTCKGQSHALLSYCWAKQKKWFVTMQDLSNPGLSFVQSANLCRHLDLSSRALEYNSRQYLPNSRIEEQRAYRDVFHVREGNIHLGSLQCFGIY